MATSTQVMVEEYLHSGYQGPDCDFVDGEVIQRNVGGIDHSTVQRRLTVYFDRLAAKHELSVFPELRMKLGPRKFRVADLAIYEGPAPEERFPSACPRIVVEVVSPDDRHSEIVRKLDDYREWGVRDIWLIDPAIRRLYSYGPEGLTEVPEFTVAEFRVVLRIDDVL